MQVIQGCVFCVFSGGEDAAGRAAGFLPLLDAFPGAAAVQHPPSTGLTGQFHHTGFHHHRRNTANVTFTGVQQLKLCFLKKIAGVYEIWSKERDPIGN